MQCNDNEIREITQTAEILEKWLGEHAHGLCMDDLRDRTVLAVLLAVAFRKGSPNED